MAWASGFGSIGVTFLERLISFFRVIAKRFRSTAASGTNIKGAGWRDFPRVGLTTGFPSLPTT
jgi:hypothetical protein